MLENFVSHALRTDIGNKSSGDVLAGADLMSCFSAGVVGMRDVKNHVGVTGSGTMNFLADHKPAATCDLPNLFMKKACMSMATVNVSSLSYQACG